MPLSKNPSPQPPTDLVQLLLGVLAYADDPDITQATLTDYQGPDADTLSIGDGAGTTSKTPGNYHYDDSGYTQWGFATYA